MSTGSNRSDGTLQVGEPGERGGVLPMEEDGALAVVPVTFAEMEERLVRPVR
jgi:hypothetical protein